MSQVRKRMFYRALVIVLGVAVLTLLLFQILAPAGNAAVATPNLSQTQPLSGKIIVLDPGHGGFDGGTIGRFQQTKEAEINLAISLCLRTRLEYLGASVVMTRSDDNGLADSKKPDMAKRRELIETSGADIVLSIHQNSHPDSVNFGPAVFYLAGSEEGQRLAETMQATLNAALNTEKPRKALVGDYYILKSGEMPCIIVETGFLSNAEEEAKLRDADYQQKVADTIADGVLNYFNNVQSEI